MLGPVSHALWHVTICVHTLCRHCESGSGFTIFTQRTYHPQLQGYLYEMFKFEKNGSRTEIARSHTPPTDPMLTDVHVPGGVWYLQVKRFLACLLCHCSRQGTDQSARVNLCLIPWSIHDAHPLRQPLPTELMMHTYGMGVCRNSKLDGGVVCVAKCSWSQCGAEDRMYHFGPFYARLERSNMPVLQTASSPCSHDVPAKALSLTQVWSCVKSLPDVVCCAGVS